MEIANQSEADKEFCFPQYQYKKTNCTQKPGEGQHANSKALCHGLKFLRVVLAVICSLQRKWYGVRLCRSTCSLPCVPALYSRSNRENHVHRGIMIGYPTPLSSRVACLVPRKAGNPRPKTPTVQESKEIKTWALDHVLLQGNGDGCRPGSLGSAAVREWALTPARRSRAAAGRAGHGRSEMAHAMISSVCPDHHLNVPTDTLKGQEQAQATRMPRCRCVAAALSGRGSEGIPAREPCPSLGEAGEGHGGRPNGRNDSSERVLVPVPACGVGVQAKLTRRGLRRR